MVHISAGFAALASVFVVGSRKYSSEEERHRMQVPHNRTFVALGTGLLWVGWFGFNGGSAFAATGQAAFAIINTSIAASSAMCVWMMIDWMYAGKPTLVGSCIGAVAGLATITPAAGFVRPWAAVLIGVMAALLCYGCIIVRDKFKWDDALDVWGCHGMGGFFGSLMLGFLADEGIGGQARGGVFFGKQLCACIFTAIYSFFVSYALLKVIGLFMSVVPDASEIAMGLDVSLHGEQAYDDDIMNDVSKSNPKVRFFFCAGTGIMFRGLATLFSYCFVSICVHIFFKSLKSMYGHTCPRHRRVWVRIMMHQHAPIYKEITHCKMAFTVFLVLVHYWVAVEKCETDASTIVRRRALCSTRSHAVVKSTARFFMLRVIMRE